MNDLPHNFRNVSDVLTKHYESCLAQYGDSHLGVDWPDKADAERRYAVMLDLIREEDPKVSLLDFGCGAAHLLDFVHSAGFDSIHYTGADISEAFVEFSRKKHPKIEFHCVDILNPENSLPDFDYVVANGVFTEKLDLSYDEMWHFFCSTLEALWKHTRKGLAFNVMSTLVDWERDDLFHVPFAQLVAFASHSMSRNIVIRQDYGLYEYTTYVYR